VVKLGRGDREPPAPYVVTVPEPKEKMTIASSEPPQIEIPVPAAVPVLAKPEPIVVDRVEVVEQHAGVDTRRQVSADGKTIETVEVGTATPTAVSIDRPRATPPPPPRAARKSGQFIVQVGAFSVEANAKALQQRLGRIGQDAWVDKESLYRVRIGPFATRDEAMKARGTLEANGISAIIVAE
ncbi:MAG TPA: SPOR domain-containing protein, partial [Thermoanaerobaculia bacterium]|nr:SPOR domain-containing protein [Thermoanaerobaculia bacterium]